MLRDSRVGRLIPKNIWDKIFQVHCLGNSGKQFRNVTDSVFSYKTCRSLLIELSAEERMTSTCSVTFVLFVMLDTGNRPARMISYSKRNYPRQIEAKCNDWREREEKNKYKRKEEEKNCGVFPRELRFWIHFLQFVQQEGEKVTRRNICSE